MFTTKKDIDRHVRAAFAKLRTDNEKNLRGYTAAKMYYKIGEFQSALHYVSAYISVKKDNAAAYRLLGKCYGHLKKVENSLEAFQKSLLLDPSQQDLVIEVSKILLTDEPNLTSDKMKFWKDLVLRDDSIQDEAVVNLRFQFMSKGNPSNVVEDVIIKEITKKPLDINLRIRLVKQLLEKKKSAEAYKYVRDIEMKHIQQFSTSLDWYNTVNLVLSSYKLTSDPNSVITNKDFCCLFLNTLERQISLSLEADSVLSTVKSGNLTECSRILFEFDQLLYQFSQANLELRAEIAIQLVNYFRGQLCLHAATLLFKRDFAETFEWQDALKSGIVLLLHAYQCGTFAIPDTILGQIPEVMKYLMVEWEKVSAYRCLQAGRTLHSAFEDSPGVKGVYGNREELLLQIRGKCSNSTWKQGLFKLLFKGSDQIAAISTSYLTTCDSLTEPLYELPTRNQVESFSRQASELNTSSLQHHVYVRLKNNSLTEYDFTGFDGLNFSMSNLINCTPSTLNQLDIETFLYATVVQTRRELDLVSRRSQSGLPAILPFANMMGKMCSEDQANWWRAAYAMTTNGTSEDVAKIRSTIQDGLEVIRCVGNPRMDAQIALRVGQILQDRLENHVRKSAERSYLESRVELFYRYGVRQLKRYPNGNVASTRKFFKYTPSPEVSTSDDQDLEVLSTNAVNFLGKLYLDRERYEECVEELNESSIDGSVFYVSEANKKLAAAKTPQKDTSFASGESVSVDSKYIKRLIQAEMRKMQMSYPVRTHEESEYDFLSDEDGIFGETEARHRRSTVLTDNNKQLQLIQQMTTLLSNLQLDFTEVKKELSDVKGQLSTLQETVDAKIVQKDSAATVLEDIYRLDDEENRRQQELTSSVPTDYFSGLYNSAYPMYGYYPNVGGAAATLLQQQFQRNAAAMSLHQIPTTINAGLYGDAATLSATGLTLNPQSPQVLQRQAQMYSDQTLRLQQTATEQHLAGQAPHMPTPQLIFPPSTSMAGMAGKLQNSITGATTDQYQNNVNNSVLKTWNSTFNNAPVEKLPPVNVVITSSDPLPTNTTMSTAPPLLSVTIPPQHIKQNTFMPELSAVTPPVEASSVQKNSSHEETPPTDAQTDAELKALKAADEEGEIVRFSGTAKLFHMQEKGLIECGLGDLKILQNKADLKSYRIFMRRDQQVHKVCANHAIVPAMTVAAVKGKDKTYTWSATDSVQGTMREVKFYVRFKTLESSAEFKNVFDKVKMELETKDAVQEKPVQSTIPPKAVTFNFGGFSTPSVAPTFDELTTAPNPFTGFTFGKPKEGAEGEKTFGNLFGGLNASGGEKSSILGNSNVESTLNKSTGDDEEEEYVSTAQFQPVIPLPKLVDVKTGEENDTVLFEHRAKLLRFDKGEKEWKERGLGNMKVLVNNDDPTKVRLLMRREQVLKLCCNQLITLETKFSKMPNTETALSWYGQDYSENEVKTEMFAIRFKTADICHSFHEAILKAQKNLTGVAALPVKDLSAEKEPAKIGFGDAFKPKAGQWECKGCFVMNLANVAECVACKGPKDPPAPAQKPAQVPTIASIVNKPEFVGFGDKFKPKTGSWECKACFVNNQADTVYCLACESPKDDTVPKKAQQSLNLTTQTKFTFGMPPIDSTALSQTSTTTTNVPSTGFTFGFQPATTGILANTPGFTFDKKPEEKSPENPLPLQGKNTFSFVFTPKSPGKVKSPTKTTPSKDGEVSEEEEEIEEENNTYFTPVIPLPDKIDVKTGEENEEVVYSHRAKLFRYVDGEWKERGTGDVKILRDKSSNVLRVLMRREPILKICLNHRLTEHINYVKKDEKSWLFIVEDFSEEKLELTKFCLRFKTPEISKDFLKAAYDALGKPPVLSNGEEKQPGEVKINGKMDAEKENEEKLREKLKLPEKFFEYKTKADCSGCRGCKSEEYPLQSVENINFDLIDEKPLPLKMPDIPSSLMKSQTLKDISSTKSSFFFGGAKSFTTGTSSSTSIFAPSFGSVTTTPGTVPPLEAQKSIFESGGQSGDSIFSGSTFSFGNKNPSIFGGNSPAKTTTTAQSGSIFGGTGSPQMSTFSFAAAAKTIEKPFEGKGLFGSTFFGSTPAFGEKPTIAKTESTTASNFSFTQAINTIKSPEAKSDPEVGKDILKMDETFSFANLAKSSGTAFSAFKTAETTGGTGFIGLSNTDDFSHFGGKSGEADENGARQEDAAYDPHYEPIIALPDEIEVSTGEEHENILFRERSHLYRWDGTSKEWKERGVGELKILHHPEKGSYRFLMRREQIHKIVLNHAITTELNMSPMNKTGRSYCWAAMNFAEEPAQTESLAIRFKNTDIAASFEKLVNNCIEVLKEKEGNLEPEQD
ncbi:hypothetical protein DMENIID0001_164570 [Sergentomyia squamirostris]